MVGFATHTTGANAFLDQNALPILCRTFLYVYHSYFDYIMIIVIVKDFLHLCYSFSFIFDKMSASLFILPSLSGMLITNCSTEKDASTSSL